MRQGVTSARVPCWAIQPVDPLGRPGSITCSHRTPPGPIERAITGRVVGSPVIGLRAGTSATCASAGFGRQMRSVRGAQDRQFLGRLARGPGAPAAAAEPAVTPATQVPTSASSSPRSSLLSGFTLIR